MHAPEDIAQALRATAAWLELTGYRGLYDARRGVINVAVRADDYLPLLDRLVKHPPSGLAGIDVSLTLNR